MNDFRQYAIDIAKQQKCCVDCNQPNPTWCSLRLGIFLCINCAGKHRSYGVAISFVRSVDLDKWSSDNIKLIAAGGNVRFLKYCRDNQIQKPIKYSQVSDQLQPYRDFLQSQVSKDLELLLSESLIPEVNQTTQQDEQIYIQEDNIIEQKKIEDIQDMSLVKTIECQSNDLIQQIPSQQRSSTVNNLSQLSGRKGLGKITRKK